MNFALIGVAANVIVGASLFFALRAAGEPGYVGLAVGTSVAAWVNAGLLGAALLREGHWRPTPAVWGRLARIGISTGAMAAVLAVCALNRVPIEGWFEARILIGKEVATILVCLLGMAVYAVAAFATKAVTPADVRTALKKPAGAPPVQGDPLG